MRACARSRGRSFATRYQEGLWRSDMNLRQVGPELQAHPVDSAARPDPGEVALLDMNLADAAHARAQPPGAAVEPRLDAEHVLAFLRQVHGHDRGHREGKDLARHRGHGELAVLAER